MSRVRVSTIEPKTTGHDPIPYRFTPVPEQFLQDPSFDMETKGMVCILMSWSRPQRGKYVVWPGVDRLASYCGCSTRTVERILQRLVKAGLIERKRRIGKSTVTDLAVVSKYANVSPDPTTVGGTVPTAYGGREVDVDEVDVDI